jgi:hypothetical protein
VQEDAPASGFNEAKETAPYGCFAAPAFAHHAKRFALLEGETDPVYGANLPRNALEQALPNGEMLF